MEISIIRIKHILKKIWQEKRMYFLLLFLITFFATIMCASNQLLSIIGTIVLNITIFAVISVIAFNLYKDKNTRIHTINLPASNLEKYISIFIINFLGVIITIYGAFLLGYYLSLQIFPNQIGFPENMEYQFSIRSIISMLSISAIMFYGSLFFKKNSLGLTCFAIIVYSMIGTWIVGLIAGEIDYNYNYYFDVTFNSIITIGFLVLTYLRLKEERA
ncbi:MAG: hypothetical protein J6U84_04155 [Bacteroidales bacterium]|nr:hypothetical protein [Bacteroidales bacterium]